MVGVLVIREKTLKFKGLHNPAPEEEMYAMPRYSAASVETKYSGTV